MRVYLKIYDRPKYYEEAELINVIDYDIKDFRIIHEVDNKDIRANFTDEELDINDEYLELQLTDGDTATFRNSYVDLFKW